MKIRQCHFCDFKAEYDDFPDGSVCYLAITACAACYENGTAEDFRRLIENENIAAEKIEMMLDLVGT